jgi:hypothetical protein
MGRPVWVCMGSNRPCSTTGRLRDSSDRLGDLRNAWGRAQRVSVGGGVTAVGDFAFTPCTSPSSVISFFRILNSFLEPVFTLFFTLWGHFFLLARPL